VIEVRTPTRVIVAYARAVLDIPTEEWQASIRLPSDTYWDNELEALPVLVEQAVAEARRLLAARRSPGSPEQPAQTRTTVQYHQLKHKPV
jgi:hypothetical protein